MIVGIIEDYGAKTSGFSLEIKSQMQRSKVEVENNLMALDRARQLTSRHMYRAGGLTPFGA